MKRLLLLVLGLSSPAFATHYSTDFAYTETFIVPASKWDKPVTGIYVHTGALQRRLDGSTNESTTYWVDIKHAQLTQQWDQFIGTVIVHGELAGGDGAITLSDQGPVAQYWVYFADGTSLISDSFHVPVRKATDPIPQGASATCVRTPQFGNPGEC